MPRPAPGVTAPRYAAVFLVMMSNLMLELLITRLFSATMWYHFAFMAVSIALFGTTVGAVAVHLLPRHFRAPRAWPLAARYALAYALSIVLCTVAQLRLNVTFGATWNELGGLALSYLLIAIPFTLSGVFICLTLVHAEARLGAFYCADLLGAGVGCALFVPFMAAADGPRAVLWLGSLAALGALCMAVSAAERQTAAAAALVAVLCGVAFVAQLDRRALQVHWAKGHWDRDHEFQKWNAFSRLVVDPASAEPSGWGLSSKFPANTHPVEQKLLSIDGAAGTVLTKFDGNLDQVEHLRWDVTALAHVIRPHAKVLIIGVGGARDILTALAFGQPHTVGVEVNQDILDLLRGRFADFTGHLARRPDVELVHDEARSYVAGSRGHFDIIQASLVDTWAAAANGAYVLSENALYTVDAFRIFLDRLTPSGLLSFSRWYFNEQPGETLRLVSLASAALRQRGVARPRTHLFVARHPHVWVSVATVLVSARAFTPDELQTLHRWCVDKGFEELLTPDNAANESLATLSAPAAPPRVLAGFALDFSAPTDDRPFFFNMVRLRDALRLAPPRSDIIQGNADAVNALVWLLLIVCALALLFILGPLWLTTSRAQPVAHSGSRLVYFTSLGFGFILLELSQMQRLMIVLGHPIYGLTVVLFALLIAAGVGSLWAQRCLGPGADAHELRRVLVVLLAVAALTGLVAGRSAGWLEGRAIEVRIGASVLLLAGLGVVLGMPLPLGLALSRDDPPGHRALYWGVNGAASVCGSVIATILSLAQGISATYGAGLLAYLMAALAAAAAFPVGPTTPRPER